MVNFEIYDVTDCETITIHILPSIIGIRANQTIKFCQLTKYNTRNIDEKSYTKCGGEASPTPFYKN